MRFLDIFNKKNKKEDLFSIAYNYNGYDFVFKSNITNPVIYDEITKIITNNKFNINNIKEYKELTKNSDKGTFINFYDQWMKQLRENKYVIHLDKYMNMRSFTKAVNELLSTIGCKNRIEEDIIVEKYINELKNYSLNNQEITEEINYDILQANIIVKELRKIGYELICFFNGFDNDDKTIIPINKIEDVKALEARVSLYDKKI